MKSREEQIFDLLGQHGALSISELASLLGVAPSSARRYLAQLRGHRFIRRTRGGAALANVVAYTPLPIHKPPVAPEEARAISHQALQWIEPGDVIGLSGGRICTELALRLRLRRGLTVVTNAINIAAELVALPGIQVMLTGGYLDPRSFELVGKAVPLSLQGVRMHKYFVGTDGITVEHGMTNHSEAVALAAREFLRHSDQTILLADSLKFKRSNLYQVVPVSEISAILTTDRTPASLRAQFEAAGVRCLAAHCPAPAPASPPDLESGEGDQQKAQELAIR